MSDEVFRRSQVGHSANDLHRHGGFVAPMEQKTERENLEEAIEALNDSEETENLVDIEKDMKAETNNAFVDGFKAAMANHSEPTKAEALAFDQPKVEEIKEETKPEEAKPAEPNYDDALNIDPITAEPVKAAPIEVKQVSDDLVDDAEELAEEIEDKPEATVKSEPVNNWKMRSKENVSAATNTPAAPAKKSGGKGWKVAAIIFALIAFTLGCLVAYLIITDTKIEFAGRVISSENKEEKKTNNPSTPSNNTPDAPIDNELKFDYDNLKIDYKGLVEVADAPYKAEGHSVNINVWKIDITKDGKYYYAVTEQSAYGSMASDGMFTYFREAKNGSKWQLIQGGQSAPYCSEMTEATKKLISEYKYIDDDLGTRSIGCHKSPEDMNFYPE